MSLPKGRARRSKHDNITASVVDLSVRERMSFSLAAVAQHNSAVFQYFCSRHNRNSSVKRRIKLLFAWEEISEQGVAKKKTNRVWPRKKWNTYMHL